jgi:hypothetical protein
MTAVLVLLMNAGSANAFSWDAAKEERALQRMKQFQLQYKVPTSLSVAHCDMMLFARITSPQRRASSLMLWASLRFVLW